MNITYTGMFAPRLADMMPDDKTARQKIMTLEQRMKALPNALGEPDYPLKHHFAPGNYAREISMPAGSVVIGKIHKHAHVNVISKGRCTVYTEEGERQLEAPITFISEPGAKRVVLVHTDTVWTTIHPTDETDLDKIEDFVIAKSYDDVPAIEAQKGRVDLCLG